MHIVLEMLGTKSELKKFGLELRRARIAAGLSQTDLAVKVDCSCSQIGHIEWGDNWPSLELYIKICRAVGVKEIPLVAAA